MKAEFLKLAGVKTEKAFYKKYPTEAAFFKAHPNAKRMIKKAQVGADLNGDGVIDAEEKRKYALSLANPFNASAAPKVVGQPVTSKPDPNNPNQGSQFGLKQAGVPMVNYDLNTSGYKPITLTDKELADDKGVTETPQNFKKPKKKKPETKYAQYAGDLVGGLQNLKADKKATEDAVMWNNVYGITGQAFASRDLDKYKVNYVRPEDNIATTDAFYNSQGSGTNILTGRDGIEIQNTYAPGYLYDDLGYEPLNDSDVAKQYRMGGLVRAQVGTNIKLKNADGTISTINTGSPEYREMYESGMIQHPSAGQGNNPYWGGVLDEVEAEKRPLSEIGKLYSNYNKKLSRDQFLKTEKDKYIKQLGDQNWFGTSQTDFPENVLAEMNQKYDYDRNTYVLEQLAKKRGWMLNNREEYVDKLSPREREMMINSKYSKFLNPSIGADTASGIQQLLNTMVPGKPFDEYIHGLTPNENAEDMESKLSALKVFSPFDVPGNIIANAAKNTTTSSYGDFRDKPGFGLSRMGNVSPLESMAVNPFTYEAVASLPKAVSSGYGALKNAPQALKSAGQDIRGKANIAKDILKETKQTIGEGREFTKNLKQYTKDQVSKISSNFDDDLNNTKNFISDPNINYYDRMGYYQNMVRSISNEDSFLREIYNKQNNLMKKDKDVAKLINDPYSLSADEQTAAFNKLIDGTIGSKKETLDLFKKSMTKYKNQRIYGEKPIELIKEFSDKLKNKKFKNTQEQNISPISTEEAVTAQSIRELNKFRELADNNRSKLLQHKESMDKIRNLVDRLDDDIVERTLGITKNEFYNNYAKYQNVGVPSASKKGITPIPAQQLTNVETPPAQTIYKDREAYNPSLLSQYGDRLAEVFYPSPQYDFQNPFLNPQKLIPYARSRYNLVEDIDKATNKPILDAAGNPVLKLVDEGSTRSLMMEALRKVENAPKGQSFSGSSWNTPGALSTDSYPLTLDSGLMMMGKGKVTANVAEGYQPLNSMGALTQFPELALKDINSKIALLEKQLGRKIPKAYYQNGTYYAPNIYFTKLRRGGNIEQAQQGTKRTLMGEESKNFFTNGGADALTRIIDYGTGNTPSGQIGGALGGIAGTMIGGPLGGAVGQMFGTAVGGMFGGNKKEQAQKQMMKSLATANFSSGIQGLQNQYSASVKNGGQITNPQLITKFGEYSMDDLLVPPHDADMLRAGGHLSKYTPPTARAMYTGRDSSYKMQFGGSRPLNPYSYEDGSIESLSPYNQEYMDSLAKEYLNLYYGDQPSTGDGYDDFYHSKVDNLPMVKTTSSGWIISKPGTDMEEFIEDTGDNKAPTPKKNQVVTRVENYETSDVPTTDFNRITSHLQHQLYRGNKLKAGGNVSSYAMGGELKTHWGGGAETMSHNPYLPSNGETVMFRGQSHDESDGYGNTGIGITYGDSPVEVERGEPAIELQEPNGETNLTVFGNLKIPNAYIPILGDEKAKGKKFKNYVAELSKEEKKQNNIVEKSTSILDDLELNTSFDKLKMAAAQANILGANMKLKNIADKKINAASLQSAINDTAEEYGLDADALARGKAIFDPEAIEEYAKYGINIPKQPKGGKTKKAKTTTLTTTKQTTAYKNPATPPKYLPYTQAGETGNPEWDNLEQYEKVWTPSVKEAFADPERSKKMLNYITNYSGEGAEELRNNLAMFPTDQEKINFLVSEATNQKVGPIHHLHRVIKKALNWTSTKPLDKKAEKRDEKPDKKEQEFNYDVLPQKRNEAIDVLNQVIPYLRPTDQEELDGMQLLGENYALSTNQLQPVQAQTYQPELATPYDISLQDQLNANQADYRAAQRMVGYNPAAQAILNAQKYEANQKVLGEQFRMNQAMKDQVYGANRNILNDAKLKNLAIYDQQYQRQAQALSNTKATTQAALNSIASKYAQNKLENRTLGMYENLYNYRFDPSGRAVNMNPLFQPEMPYVYSPDGEITHVKEYDEDGNFKGFKKIKKEEDEEDVATTTDQTTQRRGGKTKKNYSQSSIVRAFK